ncbi:MAG: hypothetical protein L3J88_04635 [Gammaproteobacteria bacterium]|nr:hypothetical protein [Gammaproteobacteria bacterium]MCF6362626.1 hypothetical protein [Gammaproteobacteria bacterium]
MDVPQQMLEMLLPVAEALGEELLAHVAFVGGSTTAFLVTDPITRQAVRFTEDVDLIFHVDGREELAGEVMAATPDVREYIAAQFQALLEHPEFDYAIQGNLQDNNRAELFYQRWEQISGLN